MDVDDIPGQLEELFDCSRAALDAQVTKARKAVDSLNAEKIAAAKALAELRDQCIKAKADLDCYGEYLHRASTLAGLSSEIQKSRSELEQLNAETAKETKALEALVKKRKEIEARVVTLEADARQATAERCRAQEIIEQCKKKLEAVAA